MCASPAARDVQLPVQRVRQHAGLRSVQPARSFYTSQAPGSSVVQKQGHTKRWEQATEGDYKGEATLCDWKLP